MSSHAALVVESAAGQLGRLVQLAVGSEPLERFDTLYRPGVGITAEEIKEAVWV